MAQWYPKMAQYDKKGWHAHPYIDSEFYAPFGNYEVNVTIDKKYVLASTGVLQNGNEIGYGYEDEGLKIKKNKEKNNTWRFRAENVHDFIWAADPDYKHVTRTMDDGTILRFFYIEQRDTENWKFLPEMTVKIFNFMESEVGEYLYPQYSLIQAGHGGMEYPMATMFTGHRSLQSLLGVSAHEIAHSWFQGMVATSENYLAWMDEGFANYYTAGIMPNLLAQYEERRSMEEAYARYALVANYPNFEEPLTTHADHFKSPDARNWAIYTKGSIVLSQLEYILGEDIFKSGMKRYFNEWKFKHPDENDFKRTFEKESKLELDWYFDYMINTTNTIDYSVDGVSEKNGKTVITLKKNGVVPMPIDLTITRIDGSKIQYYAPLGIMRGEKQTEATLLPDWPWTNPDYKILLDIPADDIQRIEIDEAGLMADINRANNVWSR
ncbi:MAG: M1 family metallopeptidase [Cytophagales bacterium]|nr:M1 family metallopeptidase [Cytophagales bacterium]